jgi:hypothetical protein
MAEPRNRRPLSLSGKLRACVTEALARCLSLRVRRNAPSTPADAQTLSPILRRGDVLLTDGITLLAALVRRLTGSTWSHVSMYVGPLEDGPNPCCVVEADVSAGVRAVPLTEFQGMRVRVLRPIHLEDADRSLLADWVVSRIGDGYDMACAWGLGRQLLGLPSGSRPRAPRSGKGEARRRFICSSLLAQAFLLIGYPILPVKIGGPESRPADHRYVTPRDFERAPLFKVVSGEP